MTRRRLDFRDGFPGRLTIAVLCVFALQLVVIFGAGKAKSRPPARLAAGPTYRLGDPRPAELAQLEDPTLFVLPHAQGFSGEAWRRIAPLEFESPPWSEPLRMLALPMEPVGETFIRFVEDRSRPERRGLDFPEAVLTVPYVPAPIREYRPSSVRIDGELATRRILVQPELPPVNEVLTNSVVEVVVDPQGYVWSAILSARSGSTNEMALRLAQAYRFEPIDPSGPNRGRRAEPRLMQGTLIFEWQPAPPTNSISANSPG
jgi:hypothetical protein